MKVFKMKKMKFLPFFIMAFVVSLGLYSCVDGEDSGISGYYSRPPYEGWEGYQFRRVLHFVNKNTVINYDYVANGKYWKYDIGDFSEPFPEHIGWYIQEGCAETYTYTKYGDKIYITDGTILTVVDNGDGLIEDGTDYDYRFVKW